MQSLNRVSKYILVSVIALVAVTSLLAIASPPLRNSGKQGETKQIEVMPKVISRVKALEVVNTYVIRQGEPGAAVVIEIRNNSEKPVIAIAVESGDEKDASGISTDGYKGEGETPTVILPPQGTIKMEMLINNLLPGKPLKIAGVMYLDGTEDGDEITRKTLREHKAKAKAKGSANKGGR
jgi:hypothetical protein